MTVALNGPMEGKARFFGLPGGTALQGGGVGHYHNIVYNAIQGTDFCHVLCDTKVYIVTQTPTYVHPAHSPTAESA